MTNSNLASGALAVTTIRDYGKLPGYLAVTATAPVKPRHRATTHAANRNRRHAPGHEYGDERGFWISALAPGGSASDLNEGVVVTLRGFVLTPWVPRVPGLYWKSEARQLRDAALGEMIRPGLYTPVGKTRRVLGGIGNVRLLPTAEGRLVCATSSGDSWAGIPVLLTGDAWHALSDRAFGSTCDIKGKWALLPAEYVDSLGGEVGIKRCCLVVEGKKDITSTAGSRSVEGSAWTLFEYTDDDNISQYGFAYTNFYADPGTSMGETAAHDLDNGAIDFLQDYVHGYHGRPLTEFDQEEPHFDAALSLNGLMTDHTYRDTVLAFIQRVKERVFKPATVRYDKLPGVLVDLFDSESLESLAFDYLGGLKLDTLIGDAAGLADKVEALIAYCERKEELDELLVGVVRERPNAADTLG
jgi:hypothetical protein